MLFDIIDTLENKLKESEDLLKKFSSDNLKSMLCIHSDISNKPTLIVDDMSTSTSHASDFELDSIDIPVIVDTACVENSCLNNHVMPKSKESRTQGKFVPICHNCGKIGHVRPNCYLLKSHRPWIKQDTLRKSEVEDFSSSKYVPLHRRHIKGKDNVICRNANYNFCREFQEAFKQKKLVHLSSLRHHQSHPTQMFTASGSEVEGSEGAANKSYIRHSTSYGTLGSTASAAVCSYLSKWQIKEEQIKVPQETAAKTH